MLFVDGVATVAPYILIVGYRKQLASAVNRLGIPYSVWSETPLKAPPPGADQSIVAPFSRSVDAFERQIDQLGLSWSPTHILAGTESAVFPADLWGPTFVGLTPGSMY